MSNKEYKQKLKRASYRAVDLIEMFFPHPHYPNKTIKLGPYQKDFVDYIQYGFPITKFKFSEVKNPPRGVIFITRRKVGKSQTPDTLIQMSDGSLKRFDELENGDSIISYTGNTFIKSQPITVLPTKKKECVKITAHSGRTIKCALTHPFLTEKNTLTTKYIQASNLQIGDRIAMNRTLPNIGEEIISDKEVTFLAYMIAEGSIGIYNGVLNRSFSNKDKEIVYDWIQSVENRYHKIKNRNKYYCRHQGRIDLLRSTGLAGKTSGNKFVPDVIFKSTTKQIALFLSKMINGDGYIQKKKNKTVQIEYCTKSKQLQQDLGYLFCRIGMFAHLFTKHNKKYDTDYHYLRFSSSIDIKNAQKHLSLCSRKQAILDKVNPTGWDHIDTFPFAKKIKTYIKNSRFLLKDLPFEIKNCYSLSPKKIDTILEYHPELDISKELFWDKIVSIEPLGELNTIDISVPETHNHITNGFLTHNSTMASYCGAAIMILGTESRGAPPARIGMIAASERESKLLIEKLKYALQNSKYSDKIKNVKSDEIRLTNGSKCVAHTHSSRDIRGAGYDIMIIDESAEMDESILFAAALPTVEHGDRWVAITTPQGEKGKLVEYYQKALVDRPIICKNCRKNYDQNEFAEANFPIKNDIMEMPDLSPCEECGSTEYIYGVGMYGTPYLDPWETPIIDQDQLKQTLDNHNWSAWARQEFLGHMVSEASMVFQEDWIENCINLRMRNTLNRKDDVSYIMGVDYGRQYDASAFCVTHKEDDKIVLDYIETVSGRYDHETDYDGIKDRLKKLVEFWHPSLIVPDSTGAGLPEVERLQKDLRFWEGRTKLYKEGDSLGFKFTRHNKPDLISNLLTKLSTTKLTIPPRTEPEIRDLVVEMQRFECKVLNRGYIKYGTQNYHDDRIIALALSLWGHRRTKYNKPYIKSFSYGELSQPKQNRKRKIRGFNLL